MKTIFFITVLAGCFLGCTNKKATETSLPINNNDTETKVSFFPVTSFLKGQMLQFDSLAVAPLHITTIHEKIDSEYIKREQLKTLLQSFLTPEINETNLTQYFKETKFNDQTINAVTLTYEPAKELPDSINILNWNVYVKPETGTVTKIYMVKHISKNGQKIIQQLIWQSDHYAQISEILEKADGSSELLKEEKFIWNFDQ
jgi:hypothetical protein